MVILKIGVEMRPPFHLDDIRLTKHNVTYPFQQVWDVASPNKTIMKDVLMHTVGIIAAVLNLKAPHTL